MTGRHVVVDGSNIATEGRVAPSLTQLDEAVRALQSEYHYEVVTVVVDATFGHRIDEPEREVYEDAVVNGELITPPAGAIGRGDAFVLQIAERANADVLSNDSFQEFHGSHSWLFDEGRLIGGKPVPNVGWVFVLRAPVRGAISRRSVRDARNAPKAPKAAKAAKAPATPVKRARPASAPARTAEMAAGATKEAARGGRRRRSRADGERLNEQLAYATFVIEYPIGSVVHGEVERFSSHGAYIRVGEAQCYVPLRELGDPPPRSAREVLDLGETRAFTVQRFDPDRRGIDVVPTDRSTLSRSERGAPAAEAAAPEASGMTSPPHAEEAPVSPAAKKAPAKRAPAKKTAADAAPVTTAAASTAKKAAATKGAAKKAPAAARSTATKSSAATAAKKAPAADRAAAAKKAPAAAKKRAAAPKAPAKTVVKAAKKTATTAKKAAKKTVTTAKTAATKAVATTKPAPGKAATAAKKAPAAGGPGAPAKKAPAAVPAKKAPAKRAPRKSAGS